MVQLIGLSADNPEQPVYLVDNTLSQSQHSTDHCLGHLVGIGILDVFVMHQQDHLLSCQLHPIFPPVVEGMQLTEL